MTPAVRDYVMACILNYVHPHQLGTTVLEIGSRDVNGSVRNLFPASNYVGVDKRAGVNVDIVADASRWQELEDYVGKCSVVVCCEVLEHTHRARHVVATAGQLLQPGGFFVLTCPTRGPYGGWPPHSGIDGEALRPNEWYENPSPQVVTRWLWSAFRTCTMEVDLKEYTLHACAVK